MKWERKQFVGLIAMLLVAAVAVGGIALWLHQNKLEQLQNEALAELERDVGQYDEQSIVLYETSKAKAEELAELYHAELRITENGRFATLTLPEGTTIRDVYAMDESLQYIDEMAADYRVSVSELTEEEEGSGERLPQRPQYTVSDEDYELQTYLDYLNMGEVWNRYTGSGVTVAVIDTGIDTDHPEFAGRISEYSYNASEDKIVKDWLLEDGSYDWSLIEDEVGHGTAVTGVIAASMGSGNVVGIAPNVEIIVIKAECNTNGQFKRTSDLIFGLYYAIERDVNVVNMSFGAYGAINPFAAATQLAYDSDVICVAAAGNDATSALSWPAADENVIGVGALDEWNLADYSNYGENVDLCAPGTTYTSLMGGKYGNMTGTSLASPVVAGAMALLLQNNPYTTFDDVTEVLYASSYDLGDLGRDWYYGFGALDISALVIEERGTITYDMLTDEVENMEGLFIQGHTLQELPEPERLYAVFDGWYYDDTFTQEYNHYEDKFYGEVTLYAKWANEDDGIPYTYVVLEDGTVEIRSYTGHRRYITIPEKIEGRVVSSIGDFAFDGQTRLIEVGLPSGLTHIGQYAFQNCANLISIQIPENVTQIEDYAFNGNVRLSTVAFTGNSKLQTIGDFAFSDCGSLERIELPASVQSTNGSAFYGATALHEILVQQGNTVFQSKDGVLFNLSGSTLVAFPAAWGSSYAIPENTSRIGNYAFAYAKLKEVDLHTVQSIGISSFAYSELESLSIPDSVTTLGERAFYGNENLAQLSIGDGLTKISVYAFANTSSLKKVTIPEKITVIEGCAFTRSSLEAVTFEENSALTVIAKNAFGYCNISQIDIPASVLTIGDYTFVENPLTYVGFAKDGSLHTIGAAAFTNCWLLETIELPNTLQTIGDFAFQSSGLTKVTIPANVSSLGNGAFSCCGSLASVTVDTGNAVYHDIDGVVYTLDNTTIHTYPAGRAGEHYTLEATTETVAPWAFAGTEKLGHVILPEGLTVVGEYGLYLSGIHNVTLPETLTEIQQYAFAECVNLSFVKIPDNVMQIGRHAFAYDWSLHTISFNETSKLPRLSYGAFAYSGITEFRVPANVSTMAQKVFEGCKNLSGITFAENSQLESISAYMFDGCTNLYSITFEPGSALTSIQAHGLEGMDNLQYIDFGDAKLTNIDNFAFRFCENLSGLNLPETVTNIGRYAFYGCKNLSQLTIPENVEHIGSYAFLDTNDMELYFQSETLPAYLDENWDHGTKGYYTGVSSVAESGDYRYAVLPSGNIAILEYLGSDTVVDLTQVNLGGSITIIGGSAFEGSTVTTIVLPDTLTAIQAEAFAYSALESVTIPANVTFIGREAFTHTAIASLTFAENAKITVIEQYAFEGTEQLTAVTLPASLTTLGTGAFLESGLQSLTFASGIQLEEIPQRAFAETKLTSVSLPNSVTLVNHNAFNNVQTLKSVTFGNNEGIRLMSNAFYHTGLESLHIPANVTYIGEYCFVALGNLTEFTVDENNPNYKAEDGLLLTKSGRKLIAVPAGRTGSLTVPLSVEEIGFGAFEESKLSEILFEEDANILTFGYRAFFKANNITTITVPKSVVGIDYYAFAYCENLREVIFAEDNQLKGIYEGAFLGCISLENITIPDSIVEISDFAFYGCCQITQLPISENSQVKGIYDYAFAYTGLSGEFTAPETLWDIGNYAFFGCDFNKVTIPDTNKKILTIGIGAFEGCNQLAEITLPFLGASYEDEEISWFGYIFGAGAYEANETYVPESLKTVTLTDGVSMIGIGGFAYCTNLETINVPHSVSVLWNDAFAETTAIYTLTNTISVQGNITSAGQFGMGIFGEVTFSDTVTEIGESTFFRCANLSGALIPDSVTVIGGYAFYECINLESIVIPPKVNVIGERTFHECESLICVTNNSTLNLSFGSEENGYAAYYARVIIDADGNRIYPDNYFETSDGFVFEIVNDEYYLKAYLGDMDTITLPRSINGTDYEILNFRGAKHVIIPDGITSIGNGAFMDCTILRNVDIPDSVTCIDDWAFYGCRSLEKIKIPDNVEQIGHAAFQYCVSLKQVEFGDGLTTIGGNAFSYCSNLTNVNLPDRLMKIDASAFYECSSLNGIVIPEHVTSIGASAFKNCSNIRSVEIPDGVTYIGSGAFLGCSLTSVIIPSGVMILDSAVFPKSTVLYLDDSNMQYKMLDGIIYDAELTRVVYASPQLSGEVVLPAGVTRIEAEAFSDCTQITKIVIPNSVVSIGIGAFSGCIGLTSVAIPDSITQIRQGVFAGCTNLKNVDIPDSVTSIDGYAFQDCTSLETICLPNGIKEIEGYAFRNCSSLQEITIPDGVDRVCVGLFWECVKLSAVNLPDSVVEIEMDAFRGCSSLEYIEIPENVEVIHDNAFWDCRALLQVTNYSSLELAFGGEQHLNGYLMYYAKILVDKNGRRTYAGNYFETQDGFLVEIYGEQYRLCAYLGEADIITLPESIMGCDYEIFEFCGAKHVVLPDSMKTISNQAFCGSGGLESIIIPESITHIGGGAFDGCVNLASINIPSSVESIEWRAFLSCNALLEKQEYWNKGMCIVDGWLINVEENVEYLTNIENIRGVVGGAYDNCYLLKNAILGNIELPSNVETVYITNINQGTSWLQSTLTLKNVVLCDTVGASDLRHCEQLFSNVTGVTIFVEALEEDLRWDANFPGWNNGNKVVYGDEWHWVNFYDENGTLIYSEPCLNSQIIRLPVHEIAPDEKYTYEIVGWDLDGDGEVDNIPATSVVDIEAKPVVIAKERLYTVQFADANGTVYHEVQLPYGAAITAPANPEKLGHDFVHWAGLYEGLTVTGDTVIYASWKHHGNGHEYAEPVWVDATCTEPGYNKHSCTICGEFYGTDYTEPLDHDYQENQVDATCTVGGYTQHICTRCEDSYRDSFTPAKGHSYGDWIVDVAPQCAVNGTQHRDCTVCGHREEDAAPAKGHAFEETGGTDSTCDQAGEQTLLCTDCGLTIRETLPLKQHAYEKKYTSMSFLEWLIRELLSIFWGYEGEQPYFYACADCGHIMSPEEAEEHKTGIASTACRHKSATWSITREPDCAGLGVEAQICDSCGTILAARTFGRDGHNYVEVVTDPTCTEDGYTTHTCVNCGDEYVDSHTEALGHSFVDGTCERCGEPEIQVGDVNGDGKINARDARLLLRYAAGLVGDDEIDLAAADYNGDGKINARDARAVLRFAAGLD